MADFDTTEFRATRFSRSASERITNRSFPVVMRGYDRAAVDSFVQEVLELVRDLEGRQSQESVVQRAIEEVGEETASILQRAHETADEIAARSRAQAEGRIQRAEREAELLRQEADGYSEKIVVDTRLLWEERQRLIDDIRQLADDVRATADDALGRVSMPQMLGEPETEEDGPPTEEDDPPAGDFENSLPSGPGALPPARWPAPSVRSTPRCGRVENRGTRNPSTSSRMQTATMMAIVIASPVPAEAQPSNRLDSHARGEAEADQDAGPDGRPGCDPAARVAHGRAATGRVAPPRGREGDPWRSRCRALRRQGCARLLQRGARGCPPAGAPGAAADDEGLARAGRAPAGRAQGRHGEARAGGALRPPDVHAAHDGAAGAPGERRDRGAHPRHRPDRPARDRSARDRHRHRPGRRPDLRGDRRGQLDLLRLPAGRGRPRRADPVWQAPPGESRGSPCRRRPAAALALQFSAADSLRRCSRASGSSGPSSVKSATITRRMRSLRSGSCSPWKASWRRSRAAA